jgi:hypothetical protein
MIPDAYSGFDIRCTWLILTLYPVNSEAAGKPVGDNFKTTDIWKIS